ncbi:hypothetical protein BaRGS_00001414 [Batillaria attramentaria]|uniref:4Fe-4S Wbl-type domain-containing protein n=1 Tax=Batillaria attramentaria TaxID=370345 RepID=A0ABD0M6R6_9CAEN
MSVVRLASLSAPETEQQAAVGVQCAQCALSPPCPARSIASPALDATSRPGRGPRWNSTARRVRLRAVFGGRVSTKERVFSLGSRGSE